MAGLDFLRRAGEGAKNLSKLEPRIQKVVPSTLNSGRAFPSVQYSGSAGPQMTRSQYKAMNSQQRLQKNWGAGETQSSIAEGMKHVRAGNPQGYNYLERSQANRLNRTSGEGQNIQARLKDYKAKKAKAGNGNAFEHNGRRLLTDREGKVIDGMHSRLPRTQTSNSTGPRNHSSTSQSGPNRGENSSWFKPEGHTSSTYQEQAMNTLEFGKRGLQNAAGAKDQSVSRWLGGRAARGAVWGGAIGGTVSAAQGGDFWQGAKDGAFKGAVGWTGFQGIKAATFSSRNRDILSNARNIVGYHGRDAAAASRAAGNLQNSGVSKAVDALMMNQRNAQVAKQTMNKR